MMLSKAAKSLSTAKAEKNETKSNTNPQPTEMQMAGAYRVETINWVMTNLRTTYTVPLEGVFDIVYHHKKFLKAINEAAPELQIIPNEPTSQAYTNLEEIPTEEEKFNKQFKILTDERNPTKIEVCHAIATYRNFNEIKFARDENGRYNSTLLEYMQKEKITSKPDNFMMRSTASIGVFIGMHQDLVHRNSFHLFLCQILQTVDLTETVFE
jgi:hypothetical protein